jgi:isopenicillin N synthase-like dioxygenase
MSKRTIPTVDLSKFVHGNAEEQKAFVDKLGKAFHEVGFVGVINHGIPKELVSGFYDESKTFFSQPVSIKRKYKRIYIVRYRTRKTKSSS